MGLLYFLRKFCKDAVEHIFAKHGFDKLSLFCPCLFFNATCQCQINGIIVFVYTICFERLVIEVIVTFDSQRREEKAKKKAVFFGKRKATIYYSGYKNIGLVRV